MKWIGFAICGAHKTWGKMMFAFCCWVFFLPTLLQFHSNKAQGKEASLESMSSFDLPTAFDSNCKSDNRFQVDEESHVENSSFTWNKVKCCTRSEFLPLIEMLGIQLMPLACQIVNHWLHRLHISQNNFKWHFISMSSRFFFPNPFTFVYITVVEPRSVAIAWQNEPLPHCQPNSFYLSF